VHARLSLVHAVLDEAFVQLVAVVAAWHVWHPFSGLPAPSA
jgi:hypothetical protein